MSRINKINEAKVALEKELAKENPDMKVVAEIRKAIMVLGIGLTVLDFNRNYGA